MAISLDGKVALITGASRNIGAAAARVLARQGAAVAINFHSDREAAQQVAQEVEKAGGAAFTYQADVTVRDQVDAMVAETVSRYKRLDIMVNCARPIPMQFKSFLAGKSEYLENRVIAELRAADFCCRAAFPIMKQGGGGRIVNVTSIAARVPTSLAGDFGYGTAKAALEALNKAVAVEFAPYGITVNLVAPGTVQTERAIARRGAAEMSRLGEITPMKRLPTTEDVANAILLFALDEARYLTGQILYVDGGGEMP
jgi:3-oxoacyl-[acyl-carrier protein] reductase